MEQYVIKGGNPLVGEVDIAGAKNAALAILSAAIMTDETILIENLPDVRDINVLLEAISEIGAQVERIDKSTVKINGSTIGNLSVDYEFIKKIRASYYLLGALLGKYKHAEVPLPGGCNIGSRPIDQHLRVSVLLVRMLISVMVLLLPRRRICMAAIFSWMWFLLVLLLIL